MQYSNYVVEGVRKLHPYQPGKPIDEVARELNLDPQSIIKLASNENPLGASSKAMAAIKDELSELNIYPDGSGYQLKEALSDKLNVKPEQLVLGNGSSDILDFITRVFVQDSDEVVISQHAFSIYGLLAQARNAKIVEVPAKNYGHDLKAMAAAVTDKTRIVFVTNPNNPTGTWNTSDELVEMLDCIDERVLVLLDEAYFEYVDESDYPDSLTLLKRYPNLVITRTFSKIYGLASLRVGYGICSEELSDLLNRVRPPFNVNSMALAAARAVLADDEYCQNSIRTNELGLTFLSSKFSEMGLVYIPSVANFISFELPSFINAQQGFQKLMGQGVIVRALGGYQMPQHIRVTVGTQQQNERFIEALKVVLADNK